MAQMKREDYKAVKRMDKQQLTAYLQKVYQRGFAAGQQAPHVGQAAKAAPAPDTTETEAE